MGLLQLKYFKELAEREHLTQTAKDLLVSAPSLSATIARLEKEVGCKLFEREGRNIRLNESGRIYLKYVNEIFVSLDNAKMEMNDAASRKNQNLSIAITSPIVWHDALQAFFKKHPDIRVSHTLLKRDQLEHQSESMQFDFVITATTDLVGDKWDMSILIPDDKPIFVVYPGHHFAQQGEVHFIDAKNENFIAISKGFSMRQYFDDLCAKAGFTPKIVLECDYMLRSKMLAAEYGIVLTTESGYRTGVLGNTIVVKIKDPAILRTQAIMWNKRRYLCNAAKTFRSFMVEYHQSFI